VRRLQNRAHAFQLAFDIAHAMFDRLYKCVFEVFNPLFQFVYISLPGFAFPL